MTINYPTYTQTSTPASAPATSVTISPYATTSLKGTFPVTSEGVFMGIAQNLPAARYELSSGFVSAQERVPLYGGLPIVSLIAQAQGRGCQVRRAVSTEEITGFSVINECPHMIVTANSTCPSIGAPGTINFFRLGSRARIALPIDPALIELAGQAEPQSLSWDFSKSMLIAVPAVASSGKTAPQTKLDVIIHTLCPSGRLATEDGKGNINWTDVRDDPSGRMLALIQI